MSWVRTLPGSSHLRALVVFDEVYGFLPPHPANPATKRPLVALVKPARAFGVGVVLATQNPMDLDYRALGNAGLWCIGRLQTDADRERVLDGLESSEEGQSSKELGQVIKKLKADDEERDKTAREGKEGIGGKVLEESAGDASAKRTRIDDPDYGLSTAKGRS